MRIIYEKNSSEIIKQLFVISFVSVFLLFPFSTTKNDNKIFQSAQHAHPKAKTLKLSNLKPI